MADDREITALIELLEDPDETIYEQIRDRILSIGEPVVKPLETAWELSDHGHIFRNRVEDILHTIHVDSVYKSLQEWINTEDHDLLNGALIIARYRYAELNEEHVKKRIAALRQDIWLELNEELTAFEKVRIINHILFEVHGFTGNKKDYHAPQNSFLNEVIDKKKGNPLSLAILYQVLATQLGLPIRGVNLPNHFILAYCGNGADQNHGSPLFYINAFSSGDILTGNEIDQFLDKLKLERKRSFYEPCTNKDMVLRLINNLAHSYTRQADEDRAADMIRFRTLFGHDGN
jgi:regulator of sirC expression with transglutaminase-like and TPR domain